MTDALSGSQPRQRLSDLSGKEWLQLSRSWWFQQGLGQNHKEAYYERLHPAPFSFKDVQKLIRQFTRSGATVLDPFCGVGSTLKAAALCGRNAVGVDVATKWATLAKARLQTEIPASHRKRLRLLVKRADCREYLQRMPAGSIDFVVTSPPYWAILNKDPDHKIVETRIARGLPTTYSRSQNDLGNISTYPRFLKEITVVLRGCKRVLKEGGYAVFIVGDFRHGPKFFPYHMDVTRCAIRAGFQLKGVLILIQSHKRLFPYGYPFTLVQNIHHQYAIILQKPRRGVQRATRNELRFPAVATPKSSL